jgi:hypothetical protein
MYRLRVRAIDCGAAVVLAFGLVGCSMHPLPENVSPASTYDIVHRIRCEVAEGLRDFPRNETFRKIVDNTTIGYDFTFHITEENKAASGKLEFKRPSFVGTGKGFFLDLSASAEKKRENTRAFRILEGLAEVNEKGCSTATKLANPLYPITGATGMGEVVKTYVRLEILTDLAREDKDVFSDELAFTTKLKAGATPTLELSTVAGSFKLTHASLTGNASRDDVHNVTVALSRDKDDVDVVASSKDFQGLTEGIVDSRTIRRWLKKEIAGSRNRVLLELMRRQNVDEDRRLVNKVLFGTDTP